MKNSDTIDGEGLGGVLERAAFSARHGSVQARSGQIDETMLQMQRVAGRLAREAQDAYCVWANWEGINSALGANAKLGEALQWNEMAWNLGPVRMAFFRDAMRGVYRLSDPYDAKNGPDKITLCRLALFLDSEENRNRLSSRDWALDLGHKPLVADGAAFANAGRIQSSRSLVLPKWNGGPPENPELVKLREKIKPVRDKILAHAVDVKDLDHPTINQMRRLMELTLELSTSMAFLFVGSCSSEAGVKDFAKAQSERFWAIAFQTAIDRLNNHEARRHAVLGDAAQ